ncbi:MAG: outer membrane lipoprotein carrier protein LolA [Prolixibacteraceae bacterium]|nr:outer membrane lipoprotein carrier protein LolA [Prolixibacteraceae bacterium]
MNKILLIFATLIFPFALQAQELKPVEVESERDFLQKLAANNAKTETIVCNFEQEKHVSMLAKPVEMNGTFFYKRGNRIFMHYDNPKNDKLILNEESFFIVANGNITRTDAKSNPGMKMLKEMLTACMTGDLEQFSGASRSKLSLFESAKNYVAVVEIEDKRIKKYLEKMTLTFEKSDLSLFELKIDEAHGNFTKYKFSNKKFNQPIDDIIFEF